VFIKLSNLNGESPLRHWRWGLAAVWLAISVGAVYSHYVSFAVILAQSIVVLVLVLHKGITYSWRWILYWLGMQLTLVAAYIPWLLVSWRSLTNWPAVGETLSVWQLYLRAGQVLTFGVTMPPWQLPAVIGILLLSLAIVVPLLRRQRAWVITLYLAVPLVAFYFLSLSRSFMKDKFLLLLHPAFTLILASATLDIGKLLSTLTRRYWPGRMATALILSLTLSASLVSLGHLYYDPTFFRDDYRGIVAEIERTASPNDAILISAPSQIETVGYYFRGKQTLIPLPLSRPLDTAVVEQQLEDLTVNHPRIYGIFWATDESDPERFIETWLDQHTYKAIDRWFGNLRLVTYAVPSRISAQPQVSTAYTLGESIVLGGYTLNTSQAKPGDIIQVALYWKAMAAIPERYKVFIHLVDENGKIVAQRDSEPGGGAQLTTTWQPDTQIIDRYGILLPTDTQSGKLTLRIGMYSLDSSERLSISNAERVLGDYLDLTTLSISGEGQ